MPTTLLLALACVGTLSEIPLEDPLGEIDDRGRLALEPPVDDRAPALVIANATLLTATGEAFEGALVLADGRITAVHRGAAPAVEGAATVDAAGKYITPGLIDTHSHLGVYPSPRAKAHGDGNEASAPTTPGVWAEHSFWPQDPGIERAVAGGVTTLQALPGSANLVGGRGVVLHLVPHRGSRAMRFPGAPETIKMACGENPKYVYGKKGAPSTRMGNLRGQRQAFIDAQRYLQKWQRYAEDLEAGLEAEPPERSLDKDTLAGVLRGEILPQVHCYRADDMISFLQLADEFDFQIRSFHHALEAYKIRDLLAARDVASSTWADWWGFKLEAFDGVPENAGMLTTAGARAIIHSDSAEGIQRLNQEAAKALASARRAGLEVSDDDALRWITAHPAWALGIQSQVGTLEPGKRADVVIWDAHPFSVYASAERVYIDGVLRYDASADAPPWSDFELGWEVAP